MYIRRHGKVLRLRLALVAVSIFVLALAGCAAQSGAAPGSQVATQAPAVATEVAPTIEAVVPTVAAAATEMATAAPAATTATTMTVTTAATVMIGKSDKLGDILTDDKGMTLYLFTKDTKNTSNCYDKCATAWPPLLTSGAAKAGTGADSSLLGTTTRTDGTTQVTYNGWPLYYYAKDKNPGDTTGQDVGGVWYVVSAKGEEVETPGASSATPAAAATPAATGATTTTMTMTNTVTTAATVMIGKNDKFGDIVTDDKGMTLYLYTKDTKNTSNCYDKCATAWPPLLTSGAAKAGTGADSSLLGTTTRKDGTTQVTYNGWPLYYFAKDKQAGDATGQDVGGVWYVVNAKGEEVETPAASSAAPAAGAGSSGSATAAGKTVNVAIKDFSFGEPLTVPVGTTVVWKNEDSAAHTVTASDKSFDSGSINQGGTFSFTFTKAGTFDYTCQFHPNMKGTVTVTG
jgi:predicted lipoprotein with Yx(FWY)xxD motif/plastocyanin